MEIEKMKLMKWIIDGWKSHDPVVLELLQRWVGPDAENARADMLKIVREMEDRRKWIGIMVVNAVNTLTLPLLMQSFPSPLAVSGGVVLLMLFVQLSWLIAILMTVLAFLTLTLHHETAERFLRQLRYAQKCRIFSRETPFTSASLDLMKTASMVELYIEAHRIKMLQERNSSVNEARRSGIAKRIEEQAKLFLVNPSASAYFRDEIIELTLSGK